MTWKQDYQICVCSSKMIQSSLTVIQYHSMHVPVGQYSSYPSILGNTKGASELYRWVTGTKLSHILLYHWK